jgi:hypothetical protein
MEVPMAKRFTAELVRKSAPLADKFGLEYATWLFGAEALEGLPRYAKGPRAGLLKGFVIWMRCEKGGWSPYGVAYPKSTARAWIGAGMFAPESAALSGMWLGRVEPLCGSACFLGPENRAAEMARKEREAAADAANWAEIKADMAAAKAAL